MAWLAGQQLPPQLERILLLEVRDLVDDAFIEERRVRMADRTPEADRHDAVGDDRFQPVVGKGIGRILDRIALRRQAARVAALGHLLLDPGALHGVELVLAQSPPSRPSPRPSIVTIDLPANSLTGCEQERTAWPSACTVQAPHTATPQPSFGPTMPRSSRSTQSNGLSVGASTSRGVPLTVSAIIAR